MASVAGLIASVGSDCHFERTDMLRRPQEQTADGSIVASHDRPAYLDHLRVERRLAAHTLESYARDLRALAALRRQREARTVDALDRAALEAFVRGSSEPAGCRRDRWRERSRPCAGSTAFSCSTARLTHNPADDLRPPRAWPALPKFLSLEEVDRLIAQPDVSTPLGLRDRAMIELLYATGMRVSELVAMRAADLHLDEAVPHVRREGQQGAAGSDRRAGDRLGPPLSARRPARICARVRQPLARAAARLFVTRAAARSAASGSGRS